MNRRELLRVSTVLTVAAVAGCVSSGGEDGDGGDPDDSNGTAGENGDAEATPTAEPTGTANAAKDNDGDGMTDEADEPGAFEGPADVVKAFFERVEQGEYAAANELIAADGKLDPLPQDPSEEPLTLAEIQDVDEQEAEATVAVILRDPDQTEQVPTLVHLETVDAAWRLFDIEVTESPPASPLASFDFEIDDGTVTVAHTDGDAIPATELFVRGEGLKSSGSWAELDGETDDGSVVAGSQLSVDVESVFTVRLVWEGSEVKAATLAEFDGVTAGASPTDKWLAETSTYDGSVADRTGEDPVSIAVGSTSGDAQGLAFDPPAIRIDPGTTVVWEWTGNGGSHNVVHEGGQFESELTPSGEFTFEQTFDEERLNRYYCAPHRAIGMKGVVIVGDVQE